MNSICDFRSGKDRPGIVNQLAHAILEAGCNIQDSRMTGARRRVRAHAAGLRT